MNNAYPKTFTHRGNPHAVVVVANAEQEAQLPDEYRPNITTAGSTISAADHAADVMLSPEYAQLLADREKLELDRAEFAEHVASTMRDLTADRNKLDAERARLVEGYTADKAKQDEDRKRLDDEMAKWEATKAGAAPTGSAADTAAAPTDKPASAPSPAPAPAAATPAKRVRTAKTADEA